jgi:hypothetical protein
MNNTTKWRFTPHEIKTWNKSDSRILFVATEPNGENPNSGILDMGDWFRTANKDNKYHGNKLFHNRCKMILGGVLGYESPSNFDNFRFMDLKATPGGSISNKNEIANYIQTNINEVVEYFVSQDDEFGLYPHIIVLLGNSAYELFLKYIREFILEENPQLKWVCMPHPSAQTVANELLSLACSEIPEKLEFIDRIPNKWFCRGRLNSGWTKA